MTKQFSVAEARKNLPSILDQVEKGNVTELTRRGTPIAVIIPIEQYKRMDKTSFWEALSLFRETFKDSGQDLEGSFEGLRDVSSGRTASKRNCNGVGGLARVAVWDASIAQIQETLARRKISPGCH